MKVLQPAIDKGDIKIVGQQWVKEWNPTEALSIVENALTRNNNKIDAIVASNDATPAVRSRPWPRRSWRARCRSPGKTPTSPPSSA